MFVQESKRLADQQDEAKEISDARSRGKEEAKEENCRLLAKCLELHNFLKVAFLSHYLGIFSNS